MEDEPEDSPMNAAPTGLCKIDGCTNQSAGKGGPWKNVCQYHISSEMARRHARRRELERPARADRAAKILQAAPAAAPAATPEAPPGRLTKLAQACDEAYAVYRQALAELRAAVEAA